MKHVAIFVCCLIAWSNVDEATAQVYLNEILADPATDWNGDTTVSSRTDEWIEIVNAGAASVDLSSYRLGDLSGGTSWRYGFSGVLAPGETRVVYGSDSVAWEQANGYPAFGLSLNNGGDTVFLYHLAGGDTLISDQYSYAAFAVENDRAVGRDTDGIGGWVVFDALNPYDGDTPPLGNNCAPTPGETNECSATVPTEESTWGAIKALYRFIPEN